MVSVDVLRIGHRPSRDKRITTHISLVSRAFGARSIHIDKKDVRIEETVKSVLKRFGGGMTIRTGKGWRPLIKKYPGTTVHLTMYGTQLEEVRDSLMNEDDILVIVGAEKVPADVYQLADYNVSVGNEPHSEVAALAIFLDRILNGRWGELGFEQCDTMVIPSADSKIVINNEFMEKNSLDPLIPEDSEKLLTLLRMPSNIKDHTLEVRDLALEICALMDSGERKIVETGALVHDLGRLRTHSVWHGYVGSIMVRLLGYPPSIQDIVANHVGAGIPKQEAERLGLPARDFIPRALEEKIVCVADNLIRGSEREKIGGNIDRFRSRGMKRAAKRIEELHFELSELAGLDLDELVN